EGGPGFRAQSSHAIFGELQAEADNVQKDFRRTSEKKGESKEFDEIKRGHMFMRENAGFDIYEEEFPHFLTAVQTVIDDNNIELPLFLHEAARHAGIRVPGDEKPATIPSFIDVDGMASLMEDDKEVE